MKQKLRKHRSELSLKIEEEESKQFDDGILQVVEYPTWLANVIPVPTKDGKVRVCVNHWDLNKASPKIIYDCPTYTS